MVLFLIGPAIAVSQTADHKRTLIINGQSTQVPVIQVNGHTYVGLEALTRAFKGTLSTSGNMVALSVPIGSGNSAAASTAAVAAPPPASAPRAASNHGFSSGFLAAGIEQMATLREWHTALATAIQNGIPLSDNLLAPYRAQAAKNLNLASVAAINASDRSAYQLLSREFEKMASLSDKYIKTRTNLSYISPDALEKDDLNQRIIACGHSLGAMAASGQFVDDGSCH